MKRIRFAALLLSLLAAGVGRAAPVPGAATRGVPFPGGVADADGKTAYVGCPKGRAIDAIDLATGEMRWRSTSAERPLAVVGNRLAALEPDGEKRNAARIVLVNTRDGKEVLRTEPITFPDWVVITAPSRPGEGRAFGCRAVVDKGDLYVRWQASAAYWGGPVPSRETLEAARKNAEGVVRVDLGDGTFQMQAADRMPTVKVPPEVEKEAARADPTGTERAVTVVGDWAVAADRDGAGVVLKRWDVATGKALEPITLREGRNLLGRVEPNGFALVTDHGDPRSCWVYSVDGGKELGRLTLPEAAREVRVIGRRAYVLRLLPHEGKGANLFDQPRGVTAYELATGKELWTYPIEPEVHLPPPP
jgi:hypothetical protein